MKLHGTTLFGVTLWIYFIVAIILSVYLNVSWINTFDFLLGLIALFGLSLWFVLDRIFPEDPSQPRKLPPPLAPLPAV